MNGGGAARRLWLETTGVFAAALAFLCLLAPSAPYTKELGVCESGAVRDVLAGNIILPHFIPGPIVHVPPLYWWTAALAVNAFGWNEFALRLPSILAAALTCAVVFAWAAATMGRRVGLWAALSLLLCHFFLDASRQPRMDSMLTLFVTAAVVCLERAIALRPRVLFFALAALAIGLGALTKGILGIALPGVVIALYLAVGRRFRELFRFDLIAAFTVGLAIGLAWYVAAYRIGGPKFLAWQVGMNLWNRFIPAEAGGASYCANPFWYFAPHTVTGFMPWSLYLPALAVAIWRRRDRTFAPQVDYTRCWFAAIFLLFSASSGRCLIYILPAFPPLAVVTGWLIAETLTASGIRSLTARLFTAGTAAATLGVIVIAAAGAIVLIFGVPKPLPVWLHPTDRRFVEIFAAMAAARSPWLMGWLVAYIAAGAILLAAIARANLRLQAYAVAGVAAVGSWFWFGVMNPALADHETLKPFAGEVMAAVPPDAQISYLGLGDCDLYFYSPRPIEPIFRFRCDAAAPHYLVIRERRFDAMAPAQRACLKPMLQSEPVDGNGRRLLLERIPNPPP